MNEHKIHLGGIATLITLLFFSFTGGAFAADCLAIRKNIKQERDLLKRRELIQQGLTNCPNDPVINFKHAYSLERFRKYNEALKHYQVATKLDPKYSKAYFGMGDMYLQINKPHESIKAYQKGLSIDPKDKRAARSLQEALAQAKTIQPSANFAARTAPAVATRKTVPQKTTRSLLASTTMMPYSPNTKTTFQTPQKQIPVGASPLGTETIQSFHFSKAGHSDATGSLDDNLMGSN